MNESERQVLEDSSAPEQLQVVRVLEAEGYLFRGWEGTYVMMGKPWGDLVGVGAEGNIERW